MKKIIGIALAAVCLLGCKKELHDPALRQQLTAMISSLDDKNRKAADKASDDIAAILSVNSAKMSAEQQKKLSSANAILLQASIDYSMRGLDNATKPRDQQKDNRLDGIDDAKKLISEVAATF
jgi:hypothetical protein